MKPSNYPQNLFEASFIRFLRIDSGASIKIKRDFLLRKTATSQLYNKPLSPLAIILNKRKIHLDIVL